MAEDGTPARQGSSGGRRIRHRFDPGPVVAGLFFLTAAGVFLAGGLSLTPVVPLEVLAAALLIGLGVVGIVQVLSRGRRQGR